MQVNKALRNAALVGIFIIPFIPLVVSGSLYFPFITGKNFFFRVLVEIIFGLWLVLAARDDQYRPKKGWILYAVAIFTIVITVADIFSANPYKSFWSNYERMEGLVTILHLAAYFTVLSSILSSALWWKRFWYTSIGVSMIVAIHGFVQLAGKAAIHQGGARLDASFGNATYLAVYMLFHIFITLILMVRTRPGFARYIHIPLILIQFTILFFTETRGTFLGLIFGAVIATLGIIFFEKENRILRRTAAIAFAVVFVSVACIFFFKNTYVVQHTKGLSRISSISLAEAGPRFMIWNMAWHGFQEHPVLGWGQESFNFVFNKYYDPRMYSQEQWFDRTHNIFFDWLIAGGLLGLLSYLFLFVAVLRAMWKSDRVPFLEKILATGLLAAYLVHNIFVFDNLTSYLMFFAFAAYVHSSTADPEAELFGKFFDYPITKRTVAPAALVMVIIMLYGLNYRPYKTGTLLIKALNVHDGSLDKNLQYFKDALAYRSFGTPEVREQIAQIAIQVAASNADQAVKVQFYKLADTELSAQIKSVPKDARHRLFAGLFYNRFGQFDSGLRELEAARELSPKKQTIIMELGATYVLKGDIKKGDEYFKEAFDLAPDYSEARIYYALGGIYMKDEARVKNLIGPTGYILNDDRFLNAYAQIKDYKKVAEIWMERIKLDPKNSQNHISLAATYLQMGDRVKTVSELRAAAAIDPSVASQVDTYIKEIQAGRNP